MGYADLLEKYCSIGESMDISRSELLYTAQFFDPDGMENSYIEYRSKNTRGGNYLTWRFDVLGCQPQKMGGSIPEIGSLLTVSNEGTLTFHGEDVGDYFGIKFGGDGPEVAFDHTNTLAAWRPLEIQVPPRQDTSKGRRNFSLVKNAKRVNIITEKTEGTIRNVLSVYKVGF